MHPTFRIAGPADAETIIPFMRDYYALDGHSWNEPQARNALIGLLGNSQYGLVWLVLDHQISIGYIVLTFGYSLEYLGRDAFIDEFFLLPAYRGRGWGQETLALVEQEARAHNVRAIHLEVVRGNEDAKRLYVKTGYLNHDHHLMTKRLESATAGKS